MIPAHPHTCGAYKDIRGATLSSFGSSPRLWAYGSGVFPNPSTQRLIPTPVGHTRASAGVAP